MKNKSFWIDNFEITKFKRLDGIIDVDICIIGAGITGLSTAYYLAKSGKKVVILEKDRVASKTTGHTTGKISIQHGKFYNYLVENYGTNYAKMYALANNESIKNIKKIIENEKIECDFEVRDSIIFSEDPGKFLELQEEANIAKELGIKAEFVKKIELPIMIQGRSKV